MSWVNRGSQGDDDWDRGGASVWLRSKTDPRWNWNARVTSIWGNDTAEQVKRFTKLYGEPPADLEYGGMKD